MQVLADLTRRARLGNVGAGAEAHCSVGIRQSLYFVHAGMVLLETSVTSVLTRARFNR